MIKKYFIIVSVFVLLFIFQTLQISIFAKNNVIQTEKKAVATSSYWNNIDKSKKVSALIPGSTLSAIEIEKSLTEECSRLIKKWDSEHPHFQAKQNTFLEFSNIAPTDKDLQSDFPIHIAPFAEIQKGKPTIEVAKERALFTYCPFCQSQSLKYNFDSINPYHATTRCCGTELYGRPADYPENYSLKSTKQVKFLHLDDSEVEVPCTEYTDKDGVVWNLYIKTLFDYYRWVDTGRELVSKYSNEFKKTGNPLFVHKIAVILDLVSDTYYGLPLFYYNEHKPLTRKEWLSNTTPNVFEPSPFGVWNRGLNNSNRGWLALGDEYIWAEPFALVKSHPAFKEVSVQKYGNPDALEKKVKEKLMKELCLSFRNIFSQRLMTNYQDAVYTNMILMGSMANDSVITQLYLPTHEVVLYNHTYHDGMNGEGAPNYMTMPYNVLLKYLQNKDGWLKFDPDFLSRNPFYKTAFEEYPKLLTTRGLQPEFGDQHIYTWHPKMKNGTIDGISKQTLEKQGSRNWPGYGFGMLKVGKADYRMDLAMNYTRVSVHNGQDALSLECWIDGVPVLRHGGYSMWWGNLQIDWKRPEFSDLKKMYPNHEIVSMPRKGEFNSWSWAYAHSVLCHNSATIDGVGTGSGWGNNRGLSSVVTFKGGEAQGAVGSGFQVLDVIDEYAWSRTNGFKPMELEWQKNKAKNITDNITTKNGISNASDFRRVLIAVETPDGKPYALDLLKLSGGSEHVLFNSAWGKRMNETLPKVKDRADNLELVLKGGGPHRGTDLSYYKEVKNVEILDEIKSKWSVEWKSDLCAYAPHPIDGSAYTRPLPMNDGIVRLRMTGFEDKQQNSSLLNAKGLWLAELDSHGNTKAKFNGVVGFENGRDFLIEQRIVKPGTDANSVFAHIIEGYREGDKPLFNDIVKLPVKSVSGIDRDIVAIKLNYPNGTADYVIYQSQEGVIELPDGTKTDARYALIRRAKSTKIVKTDICRGTFIKSNSFHSTFPGDCKGEIVDVIGDLTGTRHESALIIKPTSKWPLGTALKGKQLLVTYESDLRKQNNEGYRIEKVTNLANGLLRVDLQDSAPFILGWHDVFDMPANSKGVLRTTRPLAMYANSPYYEGMKIWFVEKNLHYTISKVAELGNGPIAETIELSGNPDLNAAGIRQGDWFVIYSICPGLKVNVAGESSNVYN